MTKRTPKDDASAEVAARRALLAALPALIPAFAAAGRAEAQNAAAVQPQSYKVAFENEYLRVLDYNSRPGMSVCGDGRHSHPAHLTVPLTPGKARIKVGGKTIEASNLVGEVFWEEAVTHEVENISGRNMRALLIEVKAAAGPRK